MEMITDFGKYDYKDYESGRNKPIEELNSVELNAQLVNNKCVCVRLEREVDMNDVAHNILRRAGNVEAAAFFEEEHKHSMEMLTRFQAETHVMQSRFDSMFDQE